MLINPLKKLTACSGIALFLTSMPMAASGQSRSYPDNLRGYKVERAVVEIKKPENKNQANEGEAGSSDSDVDQLITFGQPSIAHATPLGVTFEVPVVVAPVKKNGEEHVSLFVFK